MGMGLDMGNIVAAFIHHGRREAYLHKLALDSSILYTGVP